MMNGLILEVYQRSVKNLRTEITVDLECVLGSEKQQSQQLNFICKSYLDMRRCREVVGLGLEDLRYEVLVSYQKTSFFLYFEKWIRKQLQ